MRRLLIPSLNEKSRADVPCRCQSYALSGPRGRIEKFHPAMKRNRPAVRSIKMETPRSDIIARAFELARTGPCRNTTDIQVQLKQEGYSNIPAHFDGPSFKRQLTALIKARG